MTRVAIYARFSTEMQRDASIKDQFRVCREEAERRGWSVVEEFSDYAISGGSMNRPGIMELQSMGDRQGFDIILSESLSRLSRDQADIAAFYRWASYLEIPIITIAEGPVSELHIGLKGTMNALYRKDLGQHIRRGQQGRALDGKSPGGLAYGYRAVKRFGEDGEPVRGEREIVPEQAAIIRRIFDEYASGRSPRAIAKDLNKEGVPSPRGGQWNASTINGSKSRGNGILHNRLYAGVMDYNRQRFVSNPVTGKRTGRINDESERIAVDVPALRIVSQEVWEAVIARRRNIERAPTLNATHRPRRLLSGLIKCGVCGGPMAIRGAGRICCTYAKERGTCDNTHTFAPAKIEGMVLDGLRDSLMTPEALSAFIHAFNDEIATVRKRARTKQRQFESEIGKIDRRVKGLIDALEEGAKIPNLQQRYDELAERKETLERQVAALDDPRVIELHPNLPALYRRQIDNLREALTADERSRAEAREAIRQMLDHVAVTPHGRGKYEIEIVTDVAAALRSAGADPGFTVSMVAEEGFGRIRMRHGMAL